MDKTLLSFKKADVFTPDKISYKMSTYLYNNGNLLEPAVGDGQLLKFLDLTDYDQIEIFDIKKEYLEICPNGKNIMKYNKDFLKKEIKTKYKNIILNPPFIRIQDLSEDYRKYIKDTFPLLKNGNLDIYYAFLLKCLSVLDNNGVMVAITPNSYLYNKSAKQLREYFIQNKLIEKIIDYKSEKVFNNVSTYCCITVFNKKEKDYLYYNNKKIYYKDITDNFFSNNKNGKKLKDICIIKNGVATLRDKIFIHKTKLFDEPCWKPITTGRIDKWVIFPYNENGSIIEEDIFMENNPKTYDHLVENKDELAKRDKGSKIYKRWYAFGRTQSLIKPNSEKVIYVSTMVNPVNIDYKIDSSKLSVSCLSITPKEQYTTEYILDILQKNTKYIENNSSKRGGGWINLSGRVLKNISI